MRRSCKVLGALMAVVMIVTMFSSTIFAGTGIIASGSAYGCDWILYEDYNLNVKVKDTTIKLQKVGSDYLSSVKSITVDFLNRDASLDYYLYADGCNAESMVITGFENKKVNELTIYNFTNIKNNAIKLPSGSVYKCFTLFNTSISEVNFLEDCTVKDLEFVSCNDLTSIDLKNKVEQLSVSTCKKVTSITNTDALTRSLYINSAPDLKSISFPKTLDFLGLRDCGVEEISIPGTCFAQVIGNSLKKAILEPGREKTNENMFYMAKGLESVSLPQGLTVIQYQTFRSCKNLKSVDLPSSVVTIGQGAFAMSGLESIKMPQGLKTIRHYAFAYCDNLRTVYLPSSVTEITVTAFDFDSITDVYYSGTEEQWNKISVLDNPYSNHDGLTLEEVFGGAKIHFNYVANTGWVQNNGNWFYYDTNGVKATGWKSIDGMWFYFDASGVMSTGWVQSGGKWYYMDPTLGAMVTGWKQINGKWYCFDNSGVMQTGWVGSGSTWYYLDGSGAMTTGWLDYKGKWYYFNDNGVMVTGWKQVSGKYYYFDNSGAMVTGWKQISGSYYYFKSNGAMASNEYCDGYFLNPDGTWTYKYKATWRQNSKGWWFGDDSGWYAKNRSMTINGKVYIFDTSGYCKNP